MLTLGIQILKRIASCGPGANQRAREDRAAASKPAAKKSDPKKLRKGESYMDYASQKGCSAKKRKVSFQDQA